MSDRERSTSPPARRGGARASLVALTCCLRGLALLFAAAPGTPLRVLCIVALDTVHVLRRGRPLPQKRIGELTTFVDFQACTNAYWDQKQLCAAECRAIREQLENAGLGLWAEEYLSRLRELETRRPPVAGGRRRFEEVRAYREAVARMSLATLVAIALDAESLEEALQDTHCDSEVEALFRIVMQCQIIDDVLDYAEDVSAGLPSFLTATASLPKAIELTAETARSYSSKSHRATRNGVFPLRAAASVVTAAARLVVSLADLRHRTASPFSHWRVLRHPLTRCSPIADHFSGSTEHPAAALRLDPDLLMDLQTSDSRSLRRTTRGPA